MKTRNRYVGKISGFVASLLVLAAIACTATAGGEQGMRKHKLCKTQGRAMHVTVNAAVVRWSPPIPFGKTTLTTLSGHQQAVTPAEAPLYYDSQNLNWEEAPPFGAW